MTGQDADVFRTFPERRQMNHECRDTMIEVLANASCTNSSG
jgi:hypothetical protein